MKDKQKKCTDNAGCSRLGKVGGQAVMEGIMMKSGNRCALAVRNSTKGIILDVTEVSTVRDKSKILRLPIIRGAINLVETMKMSFGMLTKSVEMLGEEFADEEPSKFEKWLEKKFGASIFTFVSILGTVLGVLLSLGLFIWLPSQISYSLSRLSNFLFDVEFNNIAITLIESIVKIAIFILYIYLTSMMKEIKRVYEYHGAEHKSIFCYESGEELTVENIKKYSRFHPRCGTSFMFVIMIISIFSMMLVSVFVPWDTIKESLPNGVVWIRTAVKLLMLPLVVGIGFEFIKYAGKHNNLLVRILSAPGLWMQRLTTREPDETQIEVAIVALKSALKEEFPDFVWENPKDEPTETEAAEETADKSPETADETSETADETSETAEERSE